MNSDAIQRVAQSMPTHMLHSLSQAATYPQTPAMYVNTVSIFMFRSTLVNGKMIKVNNQL